MKLLLPLELTVLFKRSWDDNSPENNGITASLEPSNGIEQGKHTYNTLYKLAVETSRQLFT